MTTVILIRHAQSVANINKHLIGGRANETPLSDLGADQAVRLGNHLRKQGITPDQVLSSPAVRAVETARLSLAQLSNVPDVQICDEIQEMSQGALEGRPRDEVYTPEIKRQIDIQGKDFALPDADAESMNDVADRIDHYLRQLVRKTGDGNETILLYTHGIAICCYIAKLLNLDQLQTFDRIRTLPNASLTTLQFNDSYHAPTIINFGEMID